MLHADTHTCQYCDDGKHTVNNFRIWRHSICFYGKVKKVCANYRKVIAVRHFERSAASFHESDLPCIIPSENEFLAPLSGNEWHICIGKWLMSDTRWILGARNSVFDGIFGLHTDQRGLFGCASLKSDSYKCLHYVMLCHYFRMFFPSWRDVSQRKRSIPKMWFDCFKVCLDNTVIQ